MGAEVFSRNQPWLYFPFETSGLEYILSQRVLLPCSRCIQHLFSRLL